MTKRKKYDIFISYRRIDTGQRAEHLKDLLENDYGGRISFDRENLTGLFDVELARRIDHCKDFVLLVGEKTFQYEENNCSPEEVQLYKFLASAPLNEFQKKIAQLGKNYPLDFVRIEIGRALNNNDINIIPIVPESSYTFNFFELQLPEDIEKIQRYEAVSYSSHKDALFKNIVPILKQYLKTYTNRTKKMIFSIIAILVMVILFVGGGFLKNMLSNSEPIQPTINSLLHLDSLNRTNLTEIERLRQDSIAQALQAEANRLAQERARLEEEARKAEQKRKKEAASKAQTTVSTTTTHVSSATPTASVTTPATATTTPKQTVTKKADPFAEAKAKADAGDAAASYKVAMAYKDAKNLSAAFNYMKAAAEQGYTPAYIEVAKMYHGGRGVQKNRNTAEFWYKKAAEAGNAEARRILLNM